MKTNLPNLKHTISRSGLCARRIWGSRSKNRFSTCGFFAAGEPAFPRAFSRRIFPTTPRRDRHGDRFPPRPSAVIVTERGFRRNFPSRPSRSVVPAATGLFNRCGAKFPPRPASVSVAEHGFRRNLASRPSRSVVSAVTRTFYRRGTLPPLPNRLKTSILCKISRFPRFLSAAEAARPFLRSGRVNGACRAAVQDKKRARLPRDG